MKSMRLTQFILNLLFLGMSTVAVANTSVKTVKDLRQLKQQMQQGNMLTLLLFSTEGCSYCEAIRENYLMPMMRSGDYRGQILFRQLKMDEYSLIKNEQGRLVGGDQVALRYSVDVAPTILFVDADGNEVAERIVGLSGVDYFDRTLQQHIARARKNMAND